MSRASEHLGRARRVYRSAGYPGDLAADVLPARGGRGRWVLGTAAGGLVVAAAAVTVMVRPPPTHDGSHASIVAAAVPPPADVPRPSAPVSRWPDRLSLLLPAAPLIAATPPVSLSLTSFPENLGRLQPGVDDWSAKWLENLNRRGFNVRGFGTPKKPTPEFSASTQQSA